MIFDFNKINEKVFFNKDKDLYYGNIRVDENPNIEIKRGSKVWKSFAIDDCGNYFIYHSDGEIAFLDHETDNITVLSANFDNFINNCIDSNLIELPNTDVESISKSKDFDKLFGKYLNK